LAAFTPLSEAKFIMTVTIWNWISGSQVTGSLWGGFTSPAHASLGHWNSNVRCTVEVRGLASLSLCLFHGEKMSNLCPVLAKISAESTEISRKIIYI